MTSISFNLSGKIDPILVDALRVIHQEASLLGIRFFVVGATARDLLLSHCHAIRSARMTADLDIGVEVADWEQFRQLSEALVATGRFFHTKELHRLKFDFFPVDIVPYGGVSLDFRSISWPPDHQVIMNIMGFQEAYDYSVTVRLGDAPILDVKLPTIPGMTLMKLIAWNDQYPGRPKDAEDLLFLMENYAEAGNLDRLYGPESDLLQEEGYDQALAGIRLLGRDMGAMAAAATGQAVMAILEAETGKQQRYRLVIDMIRSSRIHDRSNEVLAKLRKLAEGFFESFQG
jgi:predicted nucleotidyltransferase